MQFEGRIAADEREKALRNRHVKAIESYNEHAKELPDLDEGDCVAVQNGGGSHPKRWDKTGRVMQKLPFRQYQVKVDGSNRLTLRNRKFLRKIDPVCAHRPPTTPSTTVPSSTHPANENPEPSQEIGTLEEGPSTSAQPTVDTTPAVSMQPSGLVRRSERTKCPRELFEANVDGKYHSYKKIPTS